MERPVKGAVVIVPFPFSDLSQAKRRPALVLAVPGGDDVILVQITSQTVRDEHAIALNENDFAEGGLKKLSNVRPNRVFTADARIVLYTAGRLSAHCLENVINAVVQILRK